MLAFATVVLQIYCKNPFFDPTFYVTITKTDIGSLKFLLTLFDNQLDHVLMKFEKSRMVRNIQNFEIFGKKLLTIFGKVLTPFLKMFLWYKQ